jgi:DNA gyrase subunit A
VRLFNVGENEHVVSAAKIDESDESDDASDAVDTGPVVSDEESAAE